MFETAFPEELENRLLPLFPETRTRTLWHHNRLVRSITRTAISGYSGRTEVDSTLVELRKMANASAAEPHVRPAEESTQQV